MESSVKIRIDFYDKIEKEDIKKNFPSDYLKISPFIGNAIDVSFSDFKTYGFFRNQFSVNGSPATFIDLRKFSEDWGHFNLYLQLNDNGSLINVFPDEKIEANEVAEMVGVASALSVAAKIYGFTQADWVKIPVSEQKDFDFTHSTAIDGKFLQIEAKGSFTSDNSKKETNVSNHKSKIKGKKSDTKFKKKHPYSNNCCIGYITCIDRKNMLQTWLVDPEPKNDKMDPDHMRISKRLTYYYNIFFFIARRSYITLALSNRLSTLYNATDFSEFANQPLVNSSGEMLMISDSLKNSHQISPDLDYLGKLIVEGDDILVIGLPIALVDLIINQSFDDLITFKSLSYSKTIELQMQVSKRQIKQIKEITNPRILLKEKGDVYYLYIKTELIVASSGFCFAYEKIRT